MTFKELEISEPILKALFDKGYEVPTPIQEKAIPVLLKGSDVLGMAQTGTGKTAAFAIPIIQGLDGQEVREVREVRDSRETRGGKKGQKGQKAQISSGKILKALVLVPTRELAVQVGENFREYEKYTSVRHAVIYGGVKQKSQVDQLRRGVDILVATPGRLLDLIGQGHIRLNQIEYFVLDEADTMLDMGFIVDIKRLMQMLPKEKQTLFFSATMPKAIVTLSRDILHKPVRIEVNPESSVVDTIAQGVYYVERSDKNKLLVSILKKEDTKPTLVFSRTKRGADRLAKVLQSKGVGCEAIHGDKTQGARQKALNNFKAGRIRVIVATDVAARGIDIANLALVINYDLPDIPETYVHRIGRTGRAGNEGTALSLCASDERKMVNSIQKLTGKKIMVAMA